MKPVFYLMTFFLLTASFAIGDALLGRINDLEEIRIAARQFREEAAFLRFPTKNLVSEIDHVYHDTSVAKDAGGDSTKIRKFRTDRNGILIGEKGAASPNVKKILFLGGSTTECNEVAEQFRFPAMVESLLQKNGSNVATVNGGVRGHTTQDSINALLNRPAFRDADVDVVVLMENINDRLRLGLQGNYSATLGVDAPTTGSAVLNSAQAFVVSVWDYIAYRSNSLFLLRYWSNKNLAWLDYPQNPEISERSIDLFADSVLTRRPNFEENLLIFIRLARTIGKRPVLMTQPLGRYSSVQEQFNDSIRSVASRHQVPLVDLERELGQDQNWAFLSDNIHLNNDGSMYAAQRIAAILAPLFRN